VTFLKKLKEKYNLNQPDKWYRVSKDQLLKGGGWGVVPFFPYALSHLYPEVPWVWQHFGYVKKRAVQRVLLDLLAQLFPLLEINEEHNLDSRYSSGHTLSVDAYIPALDLAIEYQGEHHYYDNHAATGVAMTYTIRDEEKSRQCQELGICIVPIPYWWDRCIESLAATIMYYKPQVDLPIGYGATILTGHIPINAPRQMGTQKLRIMSAGQLSVNAT